MDLVQAIVARRQREATRRAWDTGYAQGAPVDGWVDVNCSGAVERVFCPAYVAPAAGDVVAVLRGGTPMVVGVLALGDADEPELGPSNPDGQASQGVSTFPAQYSWTWEGEDPDDLLNVTRFARITDVYQGHDWPAPLVTRQGWWYYQCSPAAILQGATVDAIRMRVPGRLSPTDVTTDLVFANAFAVWPPAAGAATPYGDVPAPPHVHDDVPDAQSITCGPAASWVDLSTEVGQALVDTSSPSGGLGSLAIGLTGSDNVRVPGVQRDPTSGLLEITWHR